jgi:hypothetical protein
MGLDPGWDQVRGRLFRDQALKRSQRPFLGDLGLSCTYCQEQALRGGSVGADALLELPSRPEPPGGSRVLQHCAKGSLLAPLADRSPIHSHPPIDGSTDDKRRRFSSHAAICLATLTFGKARSSQCNARRRLVRSFCTASDIGRGHAHRAGLPQLGDRTWWQIATLIQNNSDPLIRLADRPCGRLSVR